MHGLGRECLVTARVTTLKGPSAGAYYLEQLPAYYLDAGEPRGVWFGEGAGMLGLSGEVDDEAFLAVMAGRDPRRPDRDLGRGYDDASVRGFDVTCSAPKSVSVLWALGDDLVRAHVVAAHDAAVAAVAGWIEAHAHTRFRIGGEVAVVDAEGADRCGVSSAHQPHRRSPAPHPSGRGEPGALAGWAVVGVGRPVVEGRPAHPVGPLSRRATSRAHRASRRAVGRTRAGDR